MYRWTREGSDEALRLFKRAREIDPAFACAYSMAAACYWLRIASGWISDLDREKAEAAELARRGARLGENDAVALAAAAHSLAYVVHDLDTAALFVERALTLDPNLAAAWACSGAVQAWLGDPDTGIEHLTRALRLSPLDPLHAAMAEHDRLRTFHRRSLRRGRCPGGRVPCATSRIS